LCGTVFSTGKRCSGESLPGSGRGGFFVIESLHESGNDEIGSRLEIKRLFLIRIVSVNDVDDYEQYDHGDYEPDYEHFQP